MVTANATQSFLPSTRFTNIVTCVSAITAVSPTILDEPPKTKLISSDSPFLNLSYASSISSAVVEKSSVPPVSSSITIGMIRYMLL